MSVRQPSACQPDRSAGLHARTEILACVALSPVSALPRLRTIHIFAALPNRLRHDRLPLIFQVVRRALRPADRVQQEILIRGFARQESLLR